MKQAIHFIAGLPRSGSTLLCNILNQNPRFHATPTSGIIEILTAIRTQWDNVASFKAAPNDAGKAAVMKAILPAYHNITNNPVVFDKNRAWPHHAEMLDLIMDQPVKIICPVRSIVDILASFENLYRKNTGLFAMPMELSNASEYQTIENRADLWMDAAQPLGSVYNSLRDVINRGHGQKILFVEFTKLTWEPQQTMEMIYEFIGQPSFSHDFMNVEQTTFEDDMQHGIRGLHDIRGKVEPVTTDSRLIVGDTVVNKYADSQFWRTP